jgi:nucleoside-diphosphate-sugar epimerase
MKSAIRIAEPRQPDTIWPQRGARRLDFDQGPHERESAVCASLIQRMRKDAAPLSASAQTRSIGVTADAVRFLVTGASGFIGGNLCHYLLDSGQAVTALLRPQSSGRFLRGLTSLTVARGDVCDRASLLAPMRDVDVVVHAAGHVSDWGDRRTFKALNVDAVINVAEAARAAGVKRLVHLSSVSVYGFPGGIDINEDAPFTRRDRDRYSTSKAEGEQRVLAYDGRGIEVTVIRPGTVYGPNDRTTTLRLASLLQRRLFAYVNGGHLLMAPLYVDNLSALVRLASTHESAPGQAFNAADDGRTTWRQYIEWLCTELGCRPPTLSLPAAALSPIAIGMETFGRVAGCRESPPLTAYRLRAVNRDNHYSTSKAKHMLGWQPMIETREGLRHTAAWYLEQLTCSASRRTTR